MEILPDYGKHGHQQGALPCPQYRASLEAARANVSVGGDLN